MADKVYIRRSSPKRIQLEDDEGGLPIEYTEFCIMREMGWDYWTMKSQPDVFLEQVLSFLDAERRASDRMKSKKYG